MEKDTEITEVMFRVDTTGVFALFPYLVETNRPNLVTSYQHIGQHSVADYYHCINISKKATPIQYDDLKRELEGLGYNLKVVERRNYNKALRNCR
jgi:hypothetical protein